jgi:hypothetical protein
VNEHELHAERGEQIQVVREIEEPAIRDEIAAEGDDKDFPAEGVDVWSDRLEPVDEAVLTGEALTPRRLSSVSCASFARFLILSARDAALLASPRF